MSRLAALTAAATDCLRAALADARRPLLAFSGGKDAIVVAHLAGTLGVRTAVCETSFYFARQRDDVEAMAGRLGLDCAFKSSLTDDWLRRHRRVIFSDDPRVRGWTFSARQQATVKRYARQGGHDLQIFGRRTEENSVRASIYRTAAGLQCHPIRDWREADVWEYFDAHGLPRPWIYST